MRVFHTLICLFMVASLAVVPPAHGQLLKRMKERAEKQIENKVNQRADQAVDKAVDKAEEGIEDAAQSAFEKKLAESRTPVDLNLGPNATSPANAPSIQYRNTTLIDMGALGAIARMMGQDFTTTQETVFLSGYRQRTDAGETSMIYDAQTGELITLYHDKQQYSSTTFAEMMQRLEDQVSQAKAEAEAEVEAEGGDVDDVDLQFDVSFDRTGKVQDVYGVQAEQIVMSIESKVDATSEGESFKGTFYSVVDMWMTDGLAGSETMKAFQQKMAETVGESVGPMAQSNMGGMLTVMGQDPRMEGAWSKAAEEMKDVQGYPVQSTMYFVTVPEGQPLDLDLVFAESGSDEDNMEALMRMAEQQSGEQTEVTVQATLFKLTSQVSDLQVGGFDPSYLQVPDGYQRVESQF